MSERKLFFGGARGGGGRWDALINQMSKDPFINRPMEVVVGEYDEYCKRERAIADSCAEEEARLARHSRIEARFEKYMHAQYCLEPSVGDKQLESVWRDVEKIETFLEGKRESKRDQGGGL